MTRTQRGVFYLNIEAISLGECKCTKNCDLCHCLGFSAVDNGHLPSLTFKYNQTLVYGKLETCGLMQSSVIRGLHQLPSQCARVHNKSEVSLFSRGEGQKSPSPLFFPKFSVCLGCSCKTNQLPLERMLSSSQFQVWGRNRD